MMAPMNSIGTPRIEVNFELWEPTSPTRSKDQAEAPTQNLTTLPVFNDAVDLERQLRKCGVDHDERSKQFWPPDVWRALMTRKAVQKELQKYYDLDEKKAEELTERIVGPQNLRSDESPKSYLHIFTTLILVNQANQIKPMVECQCGICDEHLPLAHDNTGMWYLRHKHGAPIDCCFSHWHTVSRQNFHDYQMRLDVPTFEFDRGNKVKHYEFSREVVLPYMYCEEVKNIAPVPAISGGSGSVRRVKIHPLCHKFGELLRSINAADGLFAIKTLKQRDKKTFQSEVENLMRFSGLVHKHLVTLLATYDHDNHYSMMFPWAECDLDMYWEKKNPQPTPRDVELTRWVSQQCLGIMEAVDVIHRPTHLTDERFGRHGDIKAENILWYESLDKYGRGILVISDLGLASFNSEKSKSMIPNKGLGVTPDYRPPECDIEGGTISRAFDIWTLGCLYLEFMCWLLGGWQLKKQFDIDRITTSIHGARVAVFFDVQVPEGKEDDDPEEKEQYVFLVKEAVSKKIHELHLHKNCTLWVHEFLDVIEKDMLVVLAVDQQRQRSPALLEKLCNMDARCQRDEAYCGESAPQNRPQKVPTGTLASLNSQARASATNNHIKERLTVHKKDGEKRLHRSLTPHEYDNLAKNL